MQFLRISFMDLRLIKYFVPVFISLLKMQNLSISFTRWLICVHELYVFIFISRTKKELSCTILCLEFLFLIQFTQIEKKLKH